MNLGLRFAVKVMPSGQWIALDGENNMSLTMQEANAAVFYGRRGARELGERWVKENWNATMSNPRPTLQIEKVQRKPRLYHPW